MHKNYRRKNPRPCSGKYWLAGAKKEELKWRVRKRRRRDKRLIHHERWDDIRQFEKPVDWWNID